jgi:hypothetical protein
MRAIAALVTAIALLTQPAFACVGLEYDMTGITPQSMSRRLVDGAASIQLVRAVSRRPVPTDPILLEAYGRVYVYRFEPIELIAGRPRGAFDLYGLHEDWIEHALGPPIARRDLPRWWTEAGYVRLQEIRAPDPADSGSIACASPLTFALGSDYLVFRTNSGELLAPGFPVQEGRPARPQLLPVMERVTGPTDPWLAQVRRSAALDPVPPPNGWQILFEAIFGYANRDRSREKRGP